MGGGRRKLSFVWHSTLKVVFDDETSNKADRHMSYFDMWSTGISHDEHM